MKKDNFSRMENKKHLQEISALENLSDSAASGQIRMKILRLVMTQ